MLNPARILFLEDERYRVYEYKFERQILNFKTVSYSSANKKQSFFICIGEKRTSYIVRENKRGG